ncbi:hypothetical protein L218DRAFT_956471 [Marasmius fiardii PR-910]|nr:hypothetical protein L218DRAFT_956471 [Marasmius fiardii PR-910]
MPLPLRRRREYIARETIRRSLAIVAEHSKQGASGLSTFISEQLPPLDQVDCPEPLGSPVSVEVVNADAFVTARKIMYLDEEANGSIAVLNLASDIRPGGSWHEHSSLEFRQEDSLCYSSTLYITLKESYYPIPNVGEGSTAGVFSPGVVIFRDQLENACTELPTEQRRVVSVISVAAPRWPALTDDGLSLRRRTDLEDLREKIRLVYRMAAHYGKTHLVLGAMGCGTYECPPGQVASEMRDVLLEPEFKGWFKKIVFAVMSSTYSAFGNFEVFQDVFQGVLV